MTFDEYHQQGWSYDDDPFHERADEARRACEAEVGERVVSLYAMIYANPHMEDRWQENLDCLKRHELVPQEMTRTDLLELFGLDANEQPIAGGGVDILPFGNDEQVLGCINHPFNQP